VPSAEEVVNHVESKKLLLFADSGSSGDFAIFCTRFLFIYSFLFLKHFKGIMRKTLQWLVVLFHLVPLLQSF
jgi:hypothetical protein